MPDAVSGTNSDQSESLEQKMARAGVRFMDADLKTIMDEQAPKSYLDRTVESGVSLFARVMLDEDERQSRKHDEVEKYSKMFIKAAPLFVDRKRAVSFTIGMYALDQANPDDGLGTQVTDLALGGAKGFAMKSTMAGLGAIKASPAITGIGMGVVNRTVDAGLTRQTWMNPYTGEFSSTTGLARTVVQAADPRALATDALLFGVSEFTVGRLNYATRGAFYRHPALPTVTTGGIYGLGSGASEEVLRQKQAGEDFSLSKVLYRAGLAGSVNSLAAGVGATDRALSMRLKPLAERVGTHDASNSLSVPQRVAQFNELDARQRELQGPLLIRKQLNEVAYLAEVNNPGAAPKPVVLRLTDAPEMKVRFENELLDYRLHRALALDTKSLALAPTEVTIGGQRRPGYVQEIAGRSFEDALRAMAVERYGISTDRAAARILRDNPDISSQNQQVWISKMLLQQWDNHAHNEIMHVDRKMSNIDLADPIPAARYSSDFIPSWGKTASRVSLINDRLINQLTNKPLSPRIQDMMRAFVKDFDTPQGREALAGAGHSPQQVDGIIGRANYFAKTGMLPPRDTPNIFVQGSLRALYLLKKGQSLRFERELSEKPAQ